MLGQEQVVLRQVFFKKWRHQDSASRPAPVLVHVNYHPDKHPRMKAIAAWADSGDTSHIMRLPGGSEPNS